MAKVRFLRFRMTLQKDPATQPVIAKLKAAGVVVDGYTLYAYAAAQTLAQAIAKAGSQDPAKVAAAMHKEEFNTILENGASTKKAM